jgi:hypothetical protein
MNKFKTSATCVMSCDAQGKKNHRYSKSLFQYISKRLAFSQPAAQPTQPQLQLKLKRSRIVQT